MAIDFKSNSLLLSIILVLTFEAGLLQVKIVYTVHLRWSLVWSPALGEILVKDDFTTE